MKKKIFEYNTKIKTKVAEENKGFMPMCGWHNNYNNFNYGKTQGTITFIDGQLTIIIDYKFSFTFETLPIIKAAIKEMKLIQRTKKNE